MKKIIIPVVLGLATSAYAVKAERPLLMSDISPSQLYSKQQIESQIQNLANKQLADLSVLQREYVTLKQINAVNIDRLSKQELVLLKQHINYQSQSFVKHDEGPLPLAIFDIASAAKYKLNAHYVHEAAQPLLKLRHSSWQNFMQSLVNNDEATNVLLQAKLSALTGLSAQEHSELANALITSRSYQDPLVVKAIANSKDAKLIKSLLENNHSSQAHQILSNKLVNFDGQTQAEILQSVVKNNKKLASSALIQYAKLSANVRSESWLTAQLSSLEHGASAAKAIGITQSQVALETANAMITDPNSTRTQVANALLALKFANNDYAKSELVQLLERDQIRFDDMKLEVAKWLD